MLLIWSWVTLRTHRMHREYWTEEHNFWTYELRPLSYFKVLH